jgi:hypothetical protein
MKAHTCSWILAPLALALLGGCGGTWSRPLMAYNFDQPLLNSQWHGTYQLGPVAPAAPIQPEQEAVAAAPVKQEPAKQQPAKQERAVAAAPAKTQAAPTKSKQTPAASPRGVVAAAPEGPGFLPAAQRVVGLRDFTTETYLRHLLFVTGVEVPGSQGALADQICKAHAPNDRAAPVPGDLVFFKLNDGSLLVGVAETVEAKGAVRFIAPHRGEIRRLSAHLGKPGVIRDEGSKTELNTVLDRNLTAGRAWLGPVGLIRSHRGPGSTLAARD